MLDSNTTMLVMGTGRGGTTIITAALGAHPDIAMLDEEYTGAVFHVTGGKIRGNKLCVPHQLEWTKHWRWWHRLYGLTGYQRKRKWYNLHPRSELSISDYIERAPLQPICILREPNAVINSVQKRARRSADIAIFRWCRYMEIVEQLIEEAHSNPNLAQPVLVSFEGLVAQPEAVLQTLCNSLDIPFSPQMLEGPQRNVRYPRQGFEADKSRGGNKPNYLKQVPSLALQRYKRLMKLDICQHAAVTPTLASELA